MPARSRSKQKDQNSTHFDDIAAYLAEGVIVFDEAGTILWVNESALREHHVGDMASLGKTAATYAERFELRYRNNRVVAKNANPALRAVAGELFKDLVVEVRKPGQDELLGVHSLRCCRSNAEQGGGARIYLIITDLTEQVLAEQRFEAAFSANPAPAIICRLSDLRYIKVNPGFLEMTGFRRDEVIGKSTYEIDILTEATQRDLALEKLGQNQTIPQMEGLVPVSDGGKKHVIVAGEPLVVADEACMLFTFADLDPLKKTETALRQSEERFSKSFQFSPVPQMITLLKGFELTEVNQAFNVMTDLVTEDVLGRAATELFIWPDKASQRQIEQTIEKAGAIKGVDLTINTKNGGIITCLLSAVTVMIGGEFCVLWVLQDISERQRNEDELIAAIDAVMEDTNWFSRSVVEKLAGLRQATKPIPPSAELAELTVREREILDLICQGMSDTDMSKMLSLSPNTIRNHVSSLFRKLGVNRRSAVIIWARERGVSGRESKSSAASRAKKSKK